jgi:hypothetical protein
MDSRIGSPRAGYRNRMISHLRDRALQAVLHGAYPRLLDLPATELGPVVFNTQCHTHYLKTVFGRLPT